MIFVDTSGVHAYIDRADARHEVAADAMKAWLESGEALLTHNYVIVEAVTLAQRRLGAAAAEELLRDLVPLLTVVWIDEVVHARAADAFRAASSRRISIVDWTSFLIMRQEGIDAAFAFDADFVSQGFRIVPE